VAIRVFIISFNWKFKHIDMITLEEKVQLLREMITSKDVCTSLSKNDKKILKAIEKDVVGWNKPLILTGPNGLSK